ncbi:MAG: extracellular solute-binding protein [Sphaerochaeta sp.]|jgi:raffinose/stachyose/melibiose transport system substrate-binding protein|uniref:ABC transporter substrate-binding protein n=1 Tax=Sphaerochaeta sp. TaxID=1972642 RepID=UPI002AA880D7|nr:extracellular solute-binding protein [uncultured Sphaerochaeta sp.]
MKKMLFVVMAVLLAFSPLFAAGQQEQAAGPVTLNVLFYSPELAEQYNDMVAAYKAETGVTLDITVLQTDYRSVLTSRLNSGDVPDIFMSSAYADNSTYKDYVYDLTNEDFIKKIEPSALQGVTVDGKVLGYPFLVQSHSFIYNKKVFADNGITTLPKTLADFEAVSKKLQANGVQPFATGFKEFWVLPQTAWQAIANVPAENYGGYENFVAKLNAGELKFKDIPQMSQVFDLLDLIKKYGGPKPNESDFNDQTSSLATGKVAMIHQGNWAEDSIRKTNPEVEIGFLVGPTGNNAATAGIMFDSNQTIRIAKDGKNLDAALDWLRWLTTSEYGRNWIPGKVKQLSPIIGAAAPDSQIAKETSALLASGTPGYPWFYQMFPTGTEQQLGAILQGYCAGITNRAQTLDALDSAYAKIAKAAQ